MARTLGLNPKSMRREKDYGSVWEESTEKECSWSLKEGQNLDPWKNFYAEKLSKPSVSTASRACSGGSGTGAGPCKCWLHAVALEAPGPPGQHWPFQALSGNCSGNQESTQRPDGARLPLPMPHKQAQRPGPEAPTKPLLSCSRPRGGQRKLGRQRKRFEFLRLTGPARWKVAREAAAGDSLPELDSRRLLQGTMGWPVREHGPVTF